MRLLISPVRSTVFFLRIRPKPRRCVGPERAAVLGLRAELDPTGAANAENRNALGVSRRSAQRHSGNLSVKRRTQVQIPSPRLAFFARALRPTRATPGHRHGSP